MCVRLNGLTLIFCYQNLYFLKAYFCYQIIVLSNQFWKLGKNVRSWSECIFSHISGHNFLQIELYKQRRYKYIIIFHFLNSAIFWHIKAFFSFKKSDSNKYFMWYLLKFIKNTLLKSDYYNLITQINLPNIIKTNLGGK